jgi:EAL domain-containing protein (putative c-di-GMP-specific phosphodiesterase class I)
MSATYEVSERAPTSTFALVEMADQAELRAALGPAAYRMLSETFKDRMEKWQRSGDQSRHLDGNRYCVVFKGMQGEVECELAAAKLRRLLEEPITALGDSVVVKVHVGFVLPGAGAYDVKAALHMAEVAIGQARKRGALFQVYCKEAVTDAGAELRLVHALESSVERGEFELYFQPKIHAGFRTIVGAEALLRWHRPGGHLTAPGEFIEVAERHPVIRPLSWFVLKSAIAQCAQWPAPAGVAMNMPPNLLLDDEISTVLEDTLGIFGIDPKRVTLEVTEGVMVRDTQAMFSRLRKLRELGVRVAIDDFGTGYSSLAYFRELPADELKIDKCFVMNMASSPRDAAIVRAVIALAHNLGLRVVAEGVETEEAADMLKRDGCDVLQGYWIGRPMPVAAFRSQFLGRT